MQNPVSLWLETVSDVLVQSLKSFPELQCGNTAPETGFFITLNEDADRIKLSGAKSAMNFKKPVRLGTIVDEILTSSDAYHQATRDRVIDFGHAQFDPRQALWHGAQTIELTEKEVGMLQLLITHAPGAVTRDEILHSVWGYHPDVTTHTVETHLWRLRQKIETEPAAPRFVVTRPDGYAIGIAVRGEG